MDAMASPPAIDALRKALDCPIDWLSVTGLGWAPEILTFEWLRMLDAYCPMREASEFSQELYLLSNSSATDAELEHACAILHRARPAAEKLYLEGIGRLGGLAFLPPREHEQGKHACGGRPAAEIRATTTTGPSRFFFEFEEDDLRHAFWSCITALLDPYEDLELFAGIADPDNPPGGLQSSLSATEHRARSRIWLDLLNCHQRRFALDIASTIGATDGKTTRYVALDVHFGNSVAHAYPISRKEAVRIMGKQEFVVMDNYIRRNVE